jgi:capsular polysaccharide biosynthesis protein
VRRHWFTVLAPVILLVAAAVAVGTQRAPTYTAEARVTVGSPDVAPGALAGFAVATESLASSFSRAIDAEQVVDPIAQRLGLPANEVRSALTASPIPESPVIRIRADAGSASRATAIANAASDSLATYVQNLNTSDADGRALLRRFRRAARERSRALSERDQAQAAFDRNDSEDNLALLEKARTKLEVADTRTEALRLRYNASAQNLSTVGLVQRLTRATDASNDRSRTLQLLVFVALVAGGIIGTGLAVLRDR